MRFVYPWLLLLLSVIPIVGVTWLWLYRRAQARLSLLIAPALQSKLMPARPKATFYVQFVLVLTGLTLLAFAAARPQWGRKNEKVFTRGRNLVIALDVSRSMLAEDVHPNRLERAKTDIMDLISELKGDRAGLLAFRNKGSLICPLTTDYTFLRQALDAPGLDGVAAVILDEFHERTLETDLALAWLKALRRGRRRDRFFHRAPLSPPGCAK